ncbi:MAG: hypothetical protein Q9202_006960 [Teloschistes flavicans]
MNASSPPRASPFSWDMQSSSMPHFPCLHFISSRLAQNKLYALFILSANSPSFAPAWPISRSAQFKVIRICRRACELFPVTPEWVMDVASMPICRNPAERLEARSEDAYLIRRSLIQHEIIFSGEGLTLLTVDHIWTLKRHLLALSKSTCFGTATNVSMDSCVHLLRRINDKYRGVKLSISYLYRAHGMDLPLPTLKEVCNAYSRAFNEPGVQGLSARTGDAIPSLPELESPTDQQPADLFPMLDAGIPAIELESPTDHPPADLFPRLDPSPPAIELETPTADTRPDNPDDVTGAWALDNYLDVNVTYPSVPFSNSPLSASSPVSPSALTTTICSRCLVDVVEAAPPRSCGQEMTMLMSPDWEDFRRVGLGILKC